MDMTAALFADIPAGSLAQKPADLFGGILTSDAAGSSFKDMLGSIVKDVQNAAVGADGKVTDSSLFSDIAGTENADIPEMDRLSSSVVTGIGMSPKTERALKYLTGSMLESEMGKVDGFFSTSFFDILGLKTRLDLNVGQEKAEEDKEGGLTDLWSSLLDSLNGTEVTEMSYFSANLGNALFGEKKDSSKTAGSVLSDLFDNLSMRNKTDLLKASGTDMADMAALALMANGGFAGLSALYGAGAQKDAEMTAEDEQLSAILAVAEDSDVEAVAEVLQTMVSEAADALAEDMPQTAGNTENAAAPLTDTAVSAEPVTAAVDTDIPEAAAAPVQAAAAEIVQQPVAKTAAPVKTETEETLVIDPEVSAKAEEMGLKLTETVNVKEDTQQSNNESMPDVPNGSLKDLYLKMRNATKSYDSEITYSVEEKDEDPTDILATALKPDNSTVTAAAPEKSTETAESGIDLLERYDTIEQVLAGIEEAGALKETMAEGAVKEITLKLTPETLGEITVKIAKDAGGAVEITLAAQHRDVSELIASRASELAQSLTDKGTAVSAVHVVDPAQSGQNLAFDMSGGQNAFAFRQQGFGTPQSGTKFSVDDEEDDISVSSVTESNDTDYVPKEAKLWQKI